ncbi:hypothetical protein Taro_033825, partial [Colocasia esculenta]|nr:hypothetical protein [Colocasia esculenta]
GLRVCGYETERLFLCCVVRSRFDLSEVCPGVGTVVTAVVACGVPEWWHSFGYGWYLYPVWVFARVVKLGGPPGWAQSAHRYFACEHDRGVHRALNATALVVAFLLLPLSIDICMRAKCRALGGLLTSGSLEKLSSAGGGCSAGFLVIRGSGGVLGVFSPRGRRAEQGKCLEFVFFVKSRFDPSEVCPGVGTIVTAVVACGVPEWWHSFGYGWYLYPVWVMICDELAIVASPAILCVASNILWLGIKDQLLVSSPVTHILRLACEAYSLGSDLLVRLIA